jgi:hypothetical protein
MIRDIFDESAGLELAVGRLELQQDVIAHVTSAMMSGERYGVMTMEKEISNLKHMRRATLQLRGKFFANLP